MSPVDAHVRKSALDPRLSFAVSAPAGSGKTELLIQRTLSLLAQVEQPEAILGITFTRKAAHEMRERVLKALQDAQSDTEVDSAHQQQTRDLAMLALDQNRQKGWNLLSNPSRLRFQTIDGLCRQLAHQLCLETGMVIPPNMSENSGSLYQTAAERLLVHLDHQSSIGENLRLLAAHLEGRLDKLVELVSELLASRDSWLPVIYSGQVDEDYLAARVDELVEEELGKALTALLPYTEELEELLAYACAHQEGANWLKEALPNRIPEPKPSQLAPWQALRAFLLSGSYRDAAMRSTRSVNKSLGFPTSSEFFDEAVVKARKAQMQALLEQLREDQALLQKLNCLAILPHPDTEDSARLNRALFALLPLAAAEFDLLAQESGETDYTAVAMAAIEALGPTDQPTPLALRLDYRIDHILVDEFQDTSALQIELLERLTAGWQGSEQDGRTLFIVGDGMQSIYGFRKANVSLFIRARQQGIGQVQLQPLDLSTNFRSDQQIVDWVNHSFASIFPGEDNLVQGQVAFRSAEASRAHSDWPIALRGYANELLEAEAIADDIALKRSEGQTDLAILVRGRNHLSTILPALKARSIPWQAQDIDPLVGRMAVMDIHSLTRALCIPADRIAWLSILRAPWAGLSMADLLALAGSDGSDDHGEFQHLWTQIQQWQQNPRLSLEGGKICARLYAVFHAAFAHLGHQPLRITVEQLWQALEAGKALLDARDLSDIADYLDHLEHWETGGLVQDWTGFEQSLADLYAQPNRLSSEEPQLQIMTIHKSKGLEFDHVYLPALGRTTGINREPLLLWWQREFESGDEAYLIAAKPGISAKDAGAQSGLFAYLKAEESQREMQESARLLYVATTRARKSLFMTATLGWDEDKEKIKSPARKSMLSILWPEYEQDFVRGFDPIDQPDVSAVGTLTGIRRLPPDRPLPDFPEVAEEANPESMPESEQLPEQQPELSKNYIARLCGELIHDSLMRLVREQIAQPHKTDFLDDWQRGLANRGLSVELQKSCLTRLEEMLRQVLADPKAQWILDPTHVDSTAELEMDYLDNQGAVQLAVIDRTFIDQDVRWVIDYKSSAPENEPLEEFLQRESTAYRPQLKRYADLFTENVRTLLYFPAIPAHIEVD